MNHPKLTIKVNNKLFKHIDSPVTSVSKLVVKKRHNLNKSNDISDMKNKSVAREKIKLSDTGKSYNPKEEFESLKRRDIQKTERGCKQKTSSSWQ